MKHLSGHCGDSLSPARDPFDNRLPHSFWIALADKKRLTVAFNAFRTKCLDLNARLRHSMISIKYTKSKFFKGIHDAYEK